MNAQLDRAWMTTAEVAEAFEVSHNTISVLTYRHDQPLEWKPANVAVDSPRGGKLFLRADIEIVLAIRKRMGCTIPAAVRIFAAFPELRIEL